MARTEIDCCLHGTDLVAQTMMWRAHQRRRVQGRQAAELHEQQGTVGVWWHHLDAMVTVLCRNRVGPEWFVGCQVISPYQPTVLFEESAQDLGNLVRIEVIRPPRRDSPQSRGQGWLAQTRADRDRPPSGQIEAGTAGVGSEALAIPRGLRCQHTRHDVRLREFYRVMEQPLPRQPAEAAMECVPRAY